MYNANKTGFQPNLDKLDEIIVFPIKFIKQE
jgi:hypothetical protein